MTPAYIWDKLAGLRFAWRAPLKTVLFYTVVLFTFYPNPLLLVQQLRYWFAPDTLIRTDFTAMAEINREIDQLLPAPCPPALEYQAVQKYVYAQVRGMSDLDNWGVLDYSPDAEAVWLRGRGDCEDQAILAVSILRARGHQQAAMVGNLVHMWVEVDTQEILGPLADRTYDQNDNFAPALPAGNTVLLATAAMAAGFPVERSVIIMLALIVLCYHPSRDLPGFLGCWFITLLGFAFFRVWSAAYMADQATGITWPGVAGMLLMLAGAVAAIISGRMLSPKENRTS